VFKQLGNGEFHHVACREKLEQAVQLVEQLNFEWPGDYVVRDPEGNSFAFRNKRLLM
jgi:hypothetical protein